MISEDDFHPPITGKKKKEGIFSWCNLLGISQKQSGQQVLAA
jgi:hypothetical protein